MSNEYTPREVIRLMVNLLFAEHQDDIKGKGIIRSVYDPACGTGGLCQVCSDWYSQVLSEEERLQEDKEFNEVMEKLKKACEEDKLGRLQKILNQTREGKVIH